MPIYRVQVESEIVVIADTTEEAMKIAENSIREIDRCEFDTGLPRKIDENNLPAGWDGDCIPYGGDGNTRLKDLEIN